MFFSSYSRHCQSLYDYMVNKRVCHRIVSSEKSGIMKVSWEHWKRLDSPWTCLPPPLRSCSSCCRSSLLEVNGVFPSPLIASCCSFLVDDESNLQMQEEWRRENHLCRKHSLLPFKEVQKESFTASSTFTRVFKVWSWCCSSIFDDDVVRLTVKRKEMKTSPSPSSFFPFYPPPFDSHVQTDKYIFQHPFHFLSLVEWKEIFKPTLLIQDSSIKETWVILFVSNQMSISLICQRFMLFVSRRGSQVKHESSCNNSCNCYQKAFPWKMRKEESEFTQDVNKTLLSWQEREGKRMHFEGLSSGIKKDNIQTKSDVA